MIFISVLIIEQWISQNQFNNVLFGIVAFLLIGLIIPNIIAESQVEILKEEIINKIFN